MASHLPDQPPVHFSAEADFIATDGPHQGQTISNGDQLTNTGIIANTNFALTANFCPMPPVADMGLDALHRRPGGGLLFSSETGWFDECLSQQISDGDLLSADGTVFRTNAGLMVNFNPMPPAPDVGLDAVHVLPTGGILFSIEVDIFDQVLGVLVQHGDLLSDAGLIIQTNAQLLANFCPPAVPDMGLDALLILDSGEIWFSTEDGWLDVCHGVQISGSDLLSSAGYIVMSNAELADGFFLDSTNPPDVGLDSLWLGCECPGDVNRDQVLDGPDIGGLVRCLVGNPLPIDDCACADIDGNGLDSDDIPLFIDLLLNHPLCVSDGVCCFDIDDGPVPFDTCAIQDRPSCLSSGGVFMGIGTDCAPQGCCLPSGQCYNFAPACCVASGGIPLGDLCTTTDPGACGCGVADTDTDGDGTPDCNDGCPKDPVKTAPGVCGCGVL
ncbi:MAG: hypothetical protein V3T70_03425, partial [Phycisphaerae bacterium]